MSWLTVLDTNNGREQFCICLATRCFPVGWLLLFLLRLLSARDDEIAFDRSFRRREGSSSNAIVHGSGVDTGVANGRVLEQELKSLRMA